MHCYSYTLSRAAVSIFNGTSANRSCLVVLNSKPTCSFTRQNKNNIIRHLCSAVQSASVTEKLVEEDTLNDQDFERFEPRHSFPKYNTSRTRSRIRPIIKNNASEVFKSQYTEHPRVQARTQHEIDSFFEDNHVKIVGPNPPKPILSFEETNFSNKLTSQLAEDYDRPTLIQSVAWPIALTGRDMIGIAQTGSGKTLSYLLPAAVHVVNQHDSMNGDGPVAVVLCPTRELSVQVGTVAHSYCGRHGLRHACVYGGVSRNPQISALNKGASLVIATPGRLLDLLSSESTTMKRCSFLVLDEADRMLDMGFEPQIRQIVEQIESERQTLMWSATWPDEVRGIANDFLRDDSLFVNIGSLDVAANHNIEQHVEVLNRDEKLPRLMHLLSQILASEDPKVLIFAATKRTVDFLTSRIRRNGYRAMCTHGDKTQAQREWALNKFRSGQIEILVATDVAARGLDVNDISVVINYDYPNDAEDYVHRIGRTGRVDKKGTSYTFFTGDDANKTQGLIEVLKEANQQVNPELFDMDKYKYKRKPLQKKDYNQRQWSRPRSGNDHHRNFKMNNYYESEFNKWE